MTLQGWKVGARLHGLALLPLPGVEEQLLELGHHRAVDLQVGVTPGLIRGLRLLRALAETATQRATQVDAADVDATQKYRLAIDDQQLAVVAVVEVPAGLGRQWVDWIELQRADASLTQPRDEVRRRVERAGGVVDQVHLNALALLVDQRCRKTITDLAGFENEGLHVDVVARGLDCRKHRAVSLRPILQQRDAVSLDQRAVGHRLFECQMSIKDVRRFAAKLELGQDVTAARTGQGSTRAVNLHRRGRPRHVRHDGRQRPTASHQYGQACD